MASLAGGALAAAKTPRLDGPKSLLVRWKQGLDIAKLVIWIEEHRNMGYRRFCRRRRNGKGVRTNASSSALFGGDQVPSAGDAVHRCRELELEAGKSIFAESIAVTFAVVLLEIVGTDPGWHARVEQHRKLNILRAILGGFEARRSS